MADTQQTQAATTQRTFDITFDERELRLCEFAVWRLMHQAYHQQTVQCAKGELLAAESFWNDAQDAEKLVSKLRSFTVSTTRATGAQPLKEN